MAGEKSKGTRQMNEKADKANWAQIKIDSIGDTCCLKMEVGKRYEEKGPGGKGIAGICRDTNASIFPFQT